MSVKFLTYVYWWGASLAAGLLVKYFGWLPGENLEGYAAGVSVALLMVALGPNPRARTSEPG